MSPPLPSLFLLHRDVRTKAVPLSGDSTAREVVPLFSGGLQLFGFDGDDMVGSVVPSLVLEAHLAAAPDLSFLVLRGGSPFTSIKNVDRNLIVMSSTFPGNPRRRVLLIFDTTDRSLRMIPALPHSLQLNRTNRVLAVCNPSDERSYSLLIPGEEVTSVSKECLLEWHDVLFTSPCSATSPFSSTSPSASISPPSSTLPWQMMKMATFPKPEFADTFSADEVFSFRGRGYWADLLCGVMYCNWADVLSGSVDPVDFHFISPPPPQMKGPLARGSIPELKAFRTIGCAGGSVKFVSIDGFINRMDAWKMKHRHVRVWRLEDLKWIIEDRLSMEDLWKMPGFSELRSQFPKCNTLAPMYPFLSPEEDRVVYFALGDFSQGNFGASFPTSLYFFLRVDMRLKYVTFRRIPISPTPAMQNYFGVDSSILCPPVALAGDGKGKVLGHEAKMKGPTLAGDGKANVLGLQAKMKGPLAGDGKAKVLGLQAKMKGVRI